MVDDLHVLELGIDLIHELRVHAHELLVEDRVVEQRVGDVGGLESDLIQRARIRERVEHHIRDAVLVDGRQQ